MRTSGRVSNLGKERALFHFLPSAVKYLEAYGWYTLFVPFEFCVEPAFTWHMFIDQDWKNNFLNYIYFYMSRPYFWSLMVAQQKEVGHDRRMNIFLMKCCENIFASLQISTLLHIGNIESTGL